MGSSRGFASQGCDRRPIQARFHSGSGWNCLNRATPSNSPDHTPKGTRSGGDPPPTAWKHTISGSISLPSPGYFSPFPHGTVRYRSLRVACLGLWSAQLQTRFFVPGPTQGSTRLSVLDAYGTLTRYGAAFQTASANKGGQPPGRQTWVSDPTTPGDQRLAPWQSPGLGRNPVRSPLLRV
jgi:hypothetical protein